MEMPIIHFGALNEAGNLDEWDGYEWFDGVFIGQIIEAAYPHRGRYGLRITSYVNNRFAYVFKTGLSISIAPGESICLSFAQRFTNNPSGTVYVAKWFDDDDNLILHHDIVSSGVVRSIVRDDGGAWHSISGQTPLADGKWHWISVGLRRATSATAQDAQLTVHVDGVIEGTLSGLDVYDAFANFDTLRFGIPSYSRSGFVIDLDEVFISGEALEPFLAGGGRWLR